MLKSIKKIFSKSKADDKRLKKFDAKINRGVWRIGCKTVIGAYIGEKENSIITENGIYLIPDGTMKVQLEEVEEIKNDKWIINGEEVNVDTASIEFYLKCVYNDWCLPLLAKL